MQTSDSGSDRGRLMVMKHDGFDLGEAVAILERTPASLSALLPGLPGTWVKATEGESTWSAYDVIGHLIHGERTDWIPRARHILAGEKRPFEPFVYTEATGPWSVYLSILRDRQG